MGKYISPFDYKSGYLREGDIYVTRDLRALECTRSGKHSVLGGMDYSSSGLPSSGKPCDIVVGVFREGESPYYVDSALGVVKYLPDFGDTIEHTGMYMSSDGRCLNAFGTGAGFSHVIVGKVVFRLRDDTPMEEEPEVSQGLVIEVGKKYVNHLGEPVRILATDVAYKGYPVLGLYKRSDGDEGICRYTADGCRSVDYPEQGLFEVPEKYNKDDLVQYIDEPSNLAKKAYYSHYDPLRTHAKHVLYSGGRTSKTTDHTTFYVKDVWPAR